VPNYRRATAHTLAQIKRSVPHELPGLKPPIFVETIHSIETCHPKCRIIARGGFIDIKRPFSLMYDSAAAQVAIPGIRTSLR